MNKRQKAILLNFITVMTVTAVVVAAMFNFKDWVNRSESIKAMEHLGQIVLQYRKKHGFVPSESYVKGIKEELEGYTQLGKINYRAQWINFESMPDEILAYTEKKYPSSLLNDGYIVLQLNGHVEWMDKQEFDTLLPEQERQMEFEAMYKGSKFLSPPPL